MPQIMNEIDILLQPSEHEAFGNINGLKPWHVKNPSLVQR